MNYKNIEIAFIKLLAFCRKVTITGSQRAIRTAESMISRKVATVSER